ncbi:MULTISPECIES: zinc-binding dehydrogenase [unclassified Crossiella]|uniref:zinc-binding dehydrogenase n=1 Tax=unclassified Crossiella TaxID=2620835 RepID=UPI001FFECDB3|nr:MULTISPECIES: zinc-binding dehydrogenase [unclassified Crossiella]MCK2238270.1 zinc-binding dehydrogenase [Crossiella sp. S99.2]MCK2256310.1 zinc-binding dehydrogenase [Crossiella sp. S99.1]
MTRVREIVVAAKGGPVEVRERTAHHPAAGTALIEVEASGVAFADVHMVHGTYPAQPKFPFTPGYDLVGKVRSIGDGVSQHLIGTRVAALTVTGGWRSFAEVEATKLVPVPEGVDSPTAVAAVLNGITAFQMAARAKLGSGQTVLVHGASGGVGTLLVQLALNAGARVLGTASAAKHEAVRELGAEPIDYRGDVPARVRELAPDGVDAVFDHLGAQSYAQSWNLLARKGIVIGYGSASTYDKPGNRFLPYLPLVGRILGYKVRGLLGASNGRRADFYGIRPGAGANAALAEVFELVRSGQLEVPIAERMPLVEAAAALTKMTGSRGVGKIVLIP